MTDVSTPTIRVPLAKPITGHGGTFTHVTVREPTVAEYLDIGDPYLVGVSPREQVGFALDDKAALAAYAKLLVVEPDWLLVEAQVGWRDMRAIVKVIRGFFQDVAAGDEASATSRTNSSLDAGKTAKPSGG